MFSRGVNTAIATAEGYNAPKPQTDIEKANDEGHKMTFFYSYRDRANARKPNRPVVDVSAPLNTLDEAHQARRFGTQKVAYGFISLNEFVGTHEEVPYTDTHHTSEIAQLWMLAMNVWWVNNFIARSQSSGAASGNPRTKFAWSIAFSMGFIRLNIASLLGAGGYFYSYEYLYTHGPDCFRIRDPTPNGWKRSWEDGQSTYAARAVASIFPALGYAFYQGRWKKASFFFGLTLATSLYYEYARINVSSGTRLFYSYMANQESTRQAAWGTLAPNLKHRVDPDTHKNESVGQFQLFRITSGTLQNTIWENASHDNVPFLKSGKKFPNPYFNWQKAAQNFNDKPWKVKNDMWQMPTVLNEHVRSGATD